jgi:uncharacterized protein
VKARASGQAPRWPRQARPAARRAPALARAAALAWALAWLPALALLLAFAGVAHAQEPLPVPALSARVIDQTATLQPAQRAALESKLAAFEAEAGPQIVVLLVPTTQPEDIAAFAQRVADSWKIGRREVGDGLLVVVAKNDRRVRIEVAKSLEGAVPDLAARQIIDRAIRPAFRANDYAGGLSAGVDELIARIRGEALPAPERSGARAGAREGLQLDELGMFLLVAVPIIATVLTRMLGRRLGSVATAGAAGTIGWWFTASVVAGIGIALVALVLVGLFGIGSAVRRMGGGRSLPHIGGSGGWGGGWGGGGGGWSGGGGGFSSGGGGDFGGGGASGDW